VTQVHPPVSAVRLAVATALAEDIGPLGDLTASLIGSDIVVSAALVPRSPGVLAGRLTATEAFVAVDPDVAVAWLADDGDPIGAGQPVAHISGRLQSVLTAERTALNFVCHLCGVATMTRRFADAVSSAAEDRAGGAPPLIRDTRKTTPGLRALEKAAVRAGGGVNHRGSLSDGILVKDNHLAGLTITEAIEISRRRWAGRTVQVECDTHDQVKEALAAGAHLVLLDNMSPADAAACVALVADSAGAGTSGHSRCLVEVSGGITLDNVAAYAAAGVDLISVGAITHSAPILDIGLDIDLEAHHNPHKA